MMTVKNAIKKLSKYGQVKKVHGHYEVIQGNQAIQFTVNPGSDYVSSICIMKTTEKIDTMTDYFPMTWVDTVSEAIKWANFKEMTA